MIYTTRFQDGNEEEQINFNLINLDKIDVIVQQMLAKCKIDAWQNIINELAHDHDKELLIDQQQDL